jgi:hypothetical protein
MQVGSKCAVVQLFLGSFKQHKLLSMLSSSAGTSVCGRVVPLQQHMHSLWQAQDEDERKLLVHSECLLCLTPPLLQLSLTDYVCVYPLPML